MHTGNSLNTPLLRTIVYVVFSGIILFAAVPRTAITFLFTNSTNGYLEDCHCPSTPYGGVVRRATYINTIRAQQRNTVLIDSGDIINPSSDTLKAETLFRSYVYMGYDAIALGDQEFTFGIDWFMEHTNNLPFICANVYRKTETGLHQLVQPYIIKKIGGMRIAFIGLIGTNVFAFFNPAIKPEIEQQLLIRNPEQTIRSLIQTLNTQADIIVAVTHQGMEADKQLAKNVSGIDLIIGGHDQTLTELPVKCKKTRIVQCGKNGEHIGKLNTTIINARMKKVFLTLIELRDSYMDDKQIRYWIEQYKSAYFNTVKKKKNEPVADNALLVHMFSDPACGYCTDLKNIYFKTLWPQQYGITFNLIYHDIHDPKTKPLLKQMCKAHNITIDTLDYPTIFFWGTVYSGEHAIDERLPDAIKSVAEKMNQ